MDSKDDVLRRVKCPSRDPKCEIELIAYLHRLGSPNLTAFGQTWAEKADH